MYFGESVELEINKNSYTSIFENRFLIALQDFDNFNNSIKIFKESGIILEGDQEEKTKKTLIEKIKEIWTKFKEWIKSIWEKIKGLFKKKTAVDKIKELKIKLKSYDTTSGDKVIHVTFKGKIIPVAVFEDNKNLLSFNNISLMTNYATEGDMHKYSNTTEYDNDFNDQEKIMKKNEDYFDRFKKFIENLNDPSYYDNNELKGCFGKRSYKNENEVNENDIIVFSEHMDSELNSLNELAAKYNNIKFDLIDTMEFTKDLTDKYDRFINRISSGELKMEGGSRYNAESLYCLRKDIDTLHKFISECGKVLSILVSIDQSLCNFVDKLGSESTKPNNIEPEK